MSKHRQTIIKINLKNKTKQKQTKQKNNLKLEYTKMNKESKLVNPQAFMNSYLSGMRNGIITISLGVAIFGFSRSFKKQEARDTMKIVSVLSYLLSLSISLLTTMQMREYLKQITPEDLKQMPKFIDIYYWKLNEYVGWLLVSMAIIMSFLGLKKYIMKVVSIFI